MAHIKDPAQLLAVLEDGELSEDISREIKELLIYLKDIAGHKSSARGALTLKLAFAVKGATLDIEATLDVSKPKRPRAASTYFVTDTGAISTNHPKQEEFELGPRAVRSGE
jgi:hypothetical protein